MSNLGANIWTTGDAIQNPEISGAVVNAGGGNLQVSAHIFAGNLTGNGGGALVATAQINAGQVNSGGGTLTAQIAMFAGNINGGGGSYSLGPMFISGGDEYEPVLQGGTIIALAKVVGTGRFPNKGTGDLVAAIAMFAGDITGGGGSYSLGPMFIEGGGLTGSYPNGVVRLAGLGITLPLTADAADGLQIASSATSEVMVVVADRIRASDAVTTQGLLLHATASDQLLIRAALSIPYILQAMDALTIAGEVDVTAFKLVDAVSSLIAADDTETRATLMVSIAEALLISDLSQGAFVLAVSDALSLVAESEARLSATLAATDALLAVSASDSVGFFVAAGSDELELTDAVDTQAWLQAIVEDELEIFVTVKAGDDIIHGWVASTDSMAFTEYQNFPFNSLFSVGDRYFGVAEDGLYELTGDDDDGTPITASLRTALMDMGTRQLKDVKAAYIGYTSEGTFVLKTVTTKGGEKHEHWYRMKHGAAESAQNGRFTVGRGLRSRYWQFELVNVDGVDFDIDDVTIMYSVLSRRIR